MKKSFIMLMVVILSLFSFSLTIFPSSMSEKVHAEGTIKKGSVGGYVWELQGRLKCLGYYKGKIDGRFGWGTYWAVRNFQYKFGLKVDGVVDSKTKQMLWKATKNWKIKKKTKPTLTQPYKAHGFANNDIKIMANAVYGEARGEPYVGQVAVAAVILNRVESPSFPNTPSGVIFEPRAFTAVADGQIWLTPNNTAKKAVRDALNGWDPTGGAIYYFNPNTATSGWIWTRPQIKKIGKHIFAK